MSYNSRRRTGQTNKAKIRNAHTTFAGGSGDRRADCVVEQGNQPHAGGVLRPHLETCGSRLK
jgi:hypothetical protein